jgi:phage gp36-like protein
MGRYVNWSDCVARYKAIAQDAGSPELQAAAIEGAEDYIDAALAARYTVPFDPTPGAVKDVVIDLVYFKLTVRQDGSKELKKWIDERVKGMQDGTIMLVDASGIIAATGNYAAAEAEGRLSSFGPDTPENWAVDPDWIEDAQDERT